MFEITTREASANTAASPPATSVPEPALCSDLRRHGVDRVVLSVFFMPFTLLVLVDVAVIARNWVNTQMQT